VEDDVKERSVNVPPSVVAHELQFTSVKEETLPFPERFDWRCAPALLATDRGA
jgi:hypothetical protein